MRELEDFRRYADAVNAERYRVTCIKMDEDSGKKTFILDKKGGMTRGFSPDELEAHMPEMLRFQRRGENIYYTPLSDDLHHILIDDMTRDSLKRLQEDGFRPAVVLESSPGNYQCLLTIPKLGTEFDRDVGNRITERLNREYGDKKLCGCIHPHRAPGFENRKPKHRREDGGYPSVKLLFAERRECGKALALARRIDREYAEDAAKAREMITLYTNNMVAKLQAAGDNDGIIAAADMMLEKNPESALAQNIRLQAYAGKKDYAKVIELGEAAAAAQTEAADKSLMYYLLGAAYNAKEMKDQAIAAFRKVTDGPAAENAKAALTELTK